MDILKTNIRKRAGIKLRLTNISKFIASISNETSMSDTQFKELENRILNIKQIQIDFEQIQEAIEIACDDDSLPEHVQYRDEFTDTLESLKAVACVLSDTKRPLQTITENLRVHNNLSIDATEVKLPTIELPKFDGDYKMWLEFRDTFTSLIHNNTQISNIQKFHYLRASLEPNALKGVQSLDFTARNYEKAWELLCKRYNKTQLLIHSHLNAIFELGTLSRESSSGLRNIIDTVSEHLYALSSLKQPIQHWDIVIIHVITKKLDKTSARQWEHFKPAGELPTLQEFLDFLTSRADSLEKFEDNYCKESKDNRFVKKKTSLLASSTILCNYCKGTHSIYTCAQFLKLSVDERIQSATNLKLCKNCLCRGHDTKNCRSSSCKKCKSKHNTLLHIEKVNVTSNEGTSTESPSQVSLSAYTLHKLVLLSTALVKAGNLPGPQKTARALLDSGSQINFISEKLCKQLKLKQLASEISIIGVNKITSNLTKKCQLTISALHGGAQYTITCYVLAKITDNLPLQSINTKSWNIPKNIQLADPEFYKSGEVELLLGADIFWNTIYNQSHKLKKGFPILRNTAFGWIVCGSLNQPTTTALCNFTQTEPLQDDIQKFWEIEEVNAQSKQKSEDQFCEEHFKTNVTRTSDNRFMVKIPFKLSPELLGNSKQNAFNRLLKLEKRFDGSPELKTQYSAFLQEYSELGHMSHVNQDDDLLPSFFLPHHGVVKNDSISTKLRVVFDGSAPTDSGLSLNDLQYTGPAIIADIFEILFRFRQHQFVVMADIAKMYRQIWVHPNDRRYQKILWRNNASESPQTYVLNTVTYGTTSAPFLAMRCLQEVAYENQQEHPEASHVILNDFYVDDLITGFNSKQQAIKTCQEVSNILDKYHLHLRKWHSNSKFITDHLIHENEYLSELPLGNDSIKTLGINWNSQRDVLFFKSVEVNLPKKITKRFVLSYISKFYDPLGLISPCIITFKIFIQKLWMCKLDWDDPIPSKLSQNWLILYENLQSLSNITIPRQALFLNSKSIDVIGFCDASQNAYACCIYARTVDESDNIKIELLCSKTKVAPLKSQTIPRLELLSAVLLAELMKKVCSTLPFNYKITYWSDSQIVLAWLRKDPRSLQQFVNNRISKIQELTDTNNWFYVKSTDNPADIASRGSSAQTLHTSQLWWNGAPFLSLPKIQWPSFNVNSLPTDIPEKRKNYVTLLNRTQEQFPFHNYSSYIKLKRIIAYCIRFVTNLRIPKLQRKLGFLDTSELRNATNTLVKWAQEESFSREIEHIKTKQTLYAKCNLSSLSPFLDDNGLLRVGGRLQNSDLPYDTNHPLLLHGKHHLTKLILEEGHKNMLHAGPHQVLSYTRRQFWPTSGLQVAKQVTRKCVKCFKFKPKIQFPMMGNLPKERVTIDYPFNNTGVDLAGPLLIKDKKYRGAKLNKAWICMFICLVTKALHIELITSLSTEAFIACFRRFIARRGKPSKMWSDNGTNFVGTSKQLKEFFKQSRSDIAGICAHEEVKWSFIPPHSPHFGGLWESGIKSIKGHLFKVIGNSHLTYEELITVLAQIEATLNSRPLCPLSADPNDLSPLTPAHFLIGRSFNALPEPLSTTVPMNRLNRFELLQHMYQCFWRRWSKEYLHHLQQRNKWKTPTPNTTVGTLVLLKDDNLPPSRWLMGRVLEVHPGSDGTIRIVTVKTANSVLKRPVTKICPLPMEQNITK